MKLNNNFLKRIEELERKYGADPDSEKTKKRLEELVTLLQEYHVVNEELQKDPNYDATVQGMIASNRVIQAYEKALACPNKCYSDISRCLDCVQNRDTASMKELV